MFSDRYRQALDRIADYCGVESEFWDIFGNRHVASAETKRAIVEALGFPAGTENECEASLAAHEHANKSRPLDACLVVSENAQPASFELRGNLPNEANAIEVRLESGESFQFSAPAGWVTLPQRLPLGYHNVHVTLANEERAVMRLIVAPECAYLPPFLEHGAKTGGIALALYGLRSARNWGCGDFRDLRDACEWAVQDLGVSFVGLNPLHAIHNRRPYNTSPYLPNSIFYRNFIYLDLEAIAEFQSSAEAQRLWQAPETQREIAELRATPTVEYERVHELKLRFLKIAFQEFHGDAGFSEYVAGEGDLLYRFATYSALDEHLHQSNPDLWLWTDWPAHYQDPDSSETREFQKRHAREIQFYEWVQWQIGRQLGAAQEHARNCGLKIGLYHDMALATDRFGSDLWAHRPFYATNCRVGSPPDDFSPQGQDWAFPPPNKNHHRETGYRLFIESIRKTCRYGGALRIDHVMRLFRLYWIPEGSDATGGAYVRDNWEDLIRILALESVRQRVLIVGEDLGTVEPQVRESLARFGILSYRLFYFEREQSGAYKPGAAYPRQALVSSTTHDLPTIAGFWVNEDIEARRRAGMLDDAGYHAQLAGRSREKQKMLNVLWDAGLLPHYFPRDAAAVPELTGELHNAIIGFLTLTPSMLMVVNQEDLSKETEQQNLPGTTWQHPNWSRKMKFTLEQLRSDPEATAFTRMFHDWLQRSGRG